MEGIRGYAQLVAIIKSTGSDERTQSAKDSACGARYENPTFASEEMPGRKVRKPDELGRLANR